MLYDFLRSERWRQICKLRLIYECKSRIQVTWPIDMNFQSVKNLYKSLLCGFSCVLNRVPILLGDCCLSWICNYVVRKAFWIILCRTFFRIGTRCMVVIKKLLAYSDCCMFLDHKNNMKIRRFPLSLGSSRFKDQWEKMSSIFANGKAHTKGKDHQRQPSCSLVTVVSSPVGIFSGVSEQKCHILVRLLNYLTYLIATIKVKTNWNRIWLWVNH